MKKQVITMLLTMALVGGLLPQTANASGLDTVQETIGQSTEQSVQTETDAEEPDAATSETQGSLQDEAQSEQEGGVQTEMQLTREEDAQGETETTDEDVQEEGQTEETDAQTSESNLSLMSDSESKTTLSVKRYVGSVQTSTAYLVKGSAVTLKADARTIAENGTLTYQWYRAENGTATGSCLDTGASLRVTKNEDETETYICKVSDGVTTANAKFYVKKRNRTVNVTVANGGVTTAYDGGTQVAVTIDEGTQTTLNVNPVLSKGETATYEWEDSCIDEDESPCNSGSYTFTFDADTDYLTCYITYSDGTSDEVYFCVNQRTESDQVDFSNLGYTSKATGNSKMISLCGEPALLTYIHKGDAVTLSVEPGDSFNKTKMTYTWDISGTAVEASGASYTFTPDQAYDDVDEIYCVLSDGTTSQYAFFAVRFIEDCFHWNYSEWKTVSTGSTSSTKVQQRVCETCGNVETRKIKGTSTVRATGIRLSDTSRKIAAGKKLQLTATVTPTNATNKKVTWKSSNSKIATVDANGLVRINKKAGGKSVTITATTADGASASCKIQCMKGAVKKIRISGKKTVKAGKSLKLKAKVKTTRGKSNKKLQWSSSNPKIATVSASGKVTTFKGVKGKVKITAKATDGSGKKKTVTIRVK